VIVVEKDTVFQRIMGSQWFHESYVDSVLLMTAKGYPDYSSRDFLNSLLSRAQRVPFVYIGDADPYGADIYF
jgi:DNA topoisomerase VI subunit A